MLVSDITLQALVSMREEIKGLGWDTNRRFRQMDRRVVRFGSAHLSLSSSTARAG